MDAPGNHRYATDSIQWSYIVSTYRSSTGEMRLGIMVSSCEKFSESVIVR